MLSLIVGTLSQCVHIYEIKLYTLNILVLYLRKLGGNKCQCFVDF